MGFWWYWPPLLQGQRHRHGLQGQCRPGPHHGHSWHHQLLTSGRSSLPLNLQFCISLLCMHPSAFFNLSFLYHLLTHLSIAWSLWVSEVDSGQECCAPLMQCSTRQEHLGYALSTMVCLVSDLWSSGVVSSRTPFLLGPLWHHMVVILSQAWFSLILTFYMHISDLNSGPHVCTANHFTHWSIFPALKWLFMWGLMGLLEMSTFLSHILKHFQDIPHLHSYSTSCFSLTKTTGKQQQKSTQIHNLERIL